jgi:hypothetical protein
MILTIGRKFKSSKFLSEGFHRDSDGEGFDSKIFIDLLERRIVKFGLLMSTTSLSKYRLLKTRE